jgi:hypothetical protein
MFSPIQVPYDAKMLFNVVKLKPEYTIEDAELAMGEMCNVVKNTYRDDGGFLAGQVFRAAGFVSEEGTVGDGDVGGCLDENHIAIVTYWKSFEQHETSHADHTFKEKFDALKSMCDETFEIGYELLWQGEPE